MQQSVRNLCQKLKGDHLSPFCTGARYALTTQKRFPSEIPLTMKRLQHQVPFKQFFWSNYTICQISSRNLWRETNLFARAYRNSWTLDARVGRWMLDAGSRTLDAGLWTLDSGHWTLDGGLSMLDVGRYYLDAGLWALGTFVDCFRRKWKASFWFCLINYWKFFEYESVRTSWSRLFYGAYRNSWTLDVRVGHWTLDTGLWTLDSGHWTVEGVYPYEYMDCWKRFKEESLPDKESFYSEINNEHITDEDYTHP